MHHWPSLGGFFFKKKRYGETSLFQAIPWRFFFQVYQDFMEWRKEKKKDTLD